MSHELNLHDEFCSIFGRKFRIIPDPDFELILLSDFNKVLNQLLIHALDDTKIEFLQSDVYNFSPFILQNKENYLAEGYVIEICDGIKARLKYFMYYIANNRKPYSYRVFELEDILAELDKLIEQIVGDFFKNTQIFRGNKIVEQLSIDFKIDKIIKNWSKNNE